MNGVVSTQFDRVEVPNNAANRSCRPPFPTKQVNRRQHRLPQTFVRKRQDSRPPDYMMNRSAKFILCVLVVAGVSLPLDYRNVRRKERLLSQVVSEIGGRHTGIPLWPLGSEYHVTLTAVPNAEQLNKLTIANQLRGSVGIWFKDCEPNQEEVDHIRQNLPACQLFVIRNGTISPMGKSEKRADEQ